MSGISAKRTFFIKPCHGLLDIETPDPIRIVKTTMRGHETTIILDTNLLIDIERVVQRGNKWSHVTDAGLDNLIKLLNRCPAQSICLSPGMGFSEMPPGLAEVSRKLYEEFLSVHLPSFADAPNSIRPVYVGKTSAYGYEDLEEQHKILLALSFGPLLQLLIVEYGSQEKPLIKFEKFLDRLTKKFDLLSVKEIQIARYVFANPTSSATEIIKIRRAIRANFVKTKAGKVPKNSIDMLQIAFNGACDISLINTANVGDYSGVDGVRQDTWIATTDRKLSRFCDIFHYVNLDGRTGRYGISIETTEHACDDYWEKSAYMLEELLLSRQASESNVDWPKYLNAIERSISEVRGLFPA